ncbi:MAG: response regulator [Pyrinomonadaceae bacterium]
MCLPLLPIRNEITTDASKKAAVGRPHQKSLSIDCPPELTGLRVLLVDDEADSRELLKIILEKCEADITTASSAAEAFELFQNAQFDIIISDIGMPDEDGFSLIRKIRKLSAERRGKIPAIALTAYARAEDRQQALRAGFQMHVAKPVEPEELLTVMANLAGRFSP